MPSANSPPSQTANRTSPRDILLDFQFRRENRALLDAFEAQRAKAAAESEAQRLRLEEVERMIQLADQQRKDMDELLNEKLNEMGEHVRERDEEISKVIEHGVHQGVRSSAKEIERNVVEQLSARLPSGTLANAMGNFQDDEEQHQPRSSPPVLRREARRVSSQAQPQSAPAAPATIIPPPQRYALRRAAKAESAAAGPRSAPQSTATRTAKGKENVDTRANLSRKRSVAGVPPTALATTATPVTAPAIRERSASTSSTLSTAPSSHADEPATPPPVIPDLPFNTRGTPIQGDLDVDIYFAAAKKFARDRQVHEESEEAQTTFIVQVIKGMKREERTEIVAALAQVSLAKIDTKKRTVEFLGLWREIEEAVGAEVLAEAKAKGNLLRATATMVRR